MITFFPMKIADLIFIIAVIVFAYMAIKIYKKR